MPQEPGGLVKTIGAFLQRANEEGFRSVALPAIGTGHGKHGFSAKHAAKHVCEAIVSFSKCHQTTLSYIRIVLFQEDLFSEFAKYFEESGRENGVIRSLLGAMGNIWGAVASAFSVSTPFSREQYPSRSTKHAHSGIRTLLSEDPSACPFLHRINCFGNFGIHWKPGNCL